MNYHPPVSIQNILFSNQSFTKDLYWNQTRRAITIQEGVSIAKGGQESIKQRLQFLHPFTLERKYLTDECL